EVVGGCVGLAEQLVQPDALDELRARVDQGDVHVRTAGEPVGRHHARVAAADHDDVPTGAHGSSLVSGHPWDTGRPANVTPTWCDCCSPRVAPPLAVGGGPCVRGSAARPGELRRRRLYLPGQRTALASASLTWCSSVSVKIGRAACRGGG